MPLVSRVHKELLPMGQIDSGRKVAIVLARTAHEPNLLEPVKCLQIEARGSIRVSIRLGVQQPGFDGATKHLRATSRAHIESIAHSRQPTSLSRRLPSISQRGDLDVR